jgi:uncharacterized protein YndB with AHSA1/START domain
MPTTDTTVSPDRIEKQVTIQAPRSRIWRALTEVEQFNAWFGVSLTSSFSPGAEVSGVITLRNPERKIAMTIWIERMEPESFFSFRWHPYAIEEGIDFSAEPTTLVAFTLEEVEGGTRLTIVESGFEAIPASRRAQAFSMNDRGWTAQAENVRKFVTKSMR